MSSALSQFVDQWTLRSDPAAFSRRLAASDEEKCQILSADQHLRWKQKSPRPIQYYLQLWPHELRSSELLIDLLLDEFGYREELAEGISFEQYMEELSDLSEQTREKLAAAVAEDARTPIGTSPEAAVSIAVEHQLVYQISGTTFIYVPDRGQDSFSVGRQRRNSAAARGGCDVVIRCANSTKASLRISRKHLEVYRTGPQTFVVNRSAAGSERNGQALARGVPTQIRAGDRLTIAGILSLRVHCRDSLDFNSGLPTRKATVGTENGGEFVVEVSSGELVTTPAKDHVD